MIKWVHAHRVALGGVPRMGYKSHNWEQKVQKVQCCKPRELPSVRTNQKSQRQSWRYKFNRNITSTSVTTWMNEYKCKNGTGWAMAFGLGTAHQKKLSLYLLEKQENISWDPWLLAQSMFICWLNVCIFIECAGLLRATRNGQNNGWDLTGGLTGRRQGHLPKLNSRESQIIDPSLVHRVQVCRP